MLVNRIKKYFRAPFADEAEIERVVKEYAEYLFGSSIIFLPKAKIATVGGAGTIPDGFVIDVESKEWFVVEAELASHGTWQHIVPQISKQLAAIDSTATRDAILNLALATVRNEDRVAEVFADLGIAELDIHGTLQEILRKLPTIAVPIDSIPQDLQSWAKTLRFPVKIWVIEKYRSEDGEAIYSIPEEVNPTISTAGAGLQNVGSVISTRLSQPFQDVLQAGLIIEGQKVILEYGPRGKQKQTFTGLIRKEGVEVDGQVMSLSTAAVHCIKKAGSPRNSANGWIMWKTEDGTYLNDFYNKVYAEDETAAENVEPVGAADSGQLSAVPRV